MKHKRLWPKGGASIYWGARIGGWPGGFYDTCFGIDGGDVPNDSVDSPPYALYNKFVENVSKRPTMIQNQDSNHASWPPSFTNGAQYVTKARALGAFLEYGYGAPTGTSTTGITGIIANNATAITTLKNNLAIPMRDAAHPILFRPWWENNVSGIGAWSDAFLSAGQYQSLWINTWQAFQDVGATNVSFVYCPNRFDSGSADETTAMTYYPGNQYVDWIGMDGYEGIGVWGGHTYHGPEIVFGRAYDQLSSLHPTKPMCINEWGVWASSVAPSSPTGTLGAPGKAGFFRDFLDPVSGWLVRRAPRIKLITYFQDNQFVAAGEESLCFEQDTVSSVSCPTDPNSGAWKAFRDCLAHPRYIAGGAGMVNSITFPNGQKVPIP